MYQSGQNTIVCSTTKKRKKRGEYEENKCEGLTKNLRDQQSFWKAIKSINRGADRGNDISSEEWLAHFKSVFGTSSCEDNLSENTSDNDDDTHASEYDAELNQDIREDEVRAAIKKNLRMASHQVQIVCWASS